MITQERLKEVCTYDPETGEFVGIEGKRPKYKSWMPFGKPDKKGYLQVSIDNETIHLQRLAWLYVYGYLPSETVDHKNLNPSDNRIENLRLASRSDQCCNRAIFKSNTSGAKGVSYEKSRGKWKACVKRNKKVIFAKRFDTLEEAAAAAKEARDLHHGEFVRH